MSDKGTFGAGRALEQDQSEPLPLRCGEVHLAEKHQSPSITSAIATVSKWIWCWSRVPVPWPASRSRQAPPSPRQIFAGCGNCSRPQASGSRTASSCTTEQRAPASVKACTRCQFGRSGNQPDGSGDVTRAVSHETAPDQSTHPSPDIPRRWDATCRRNRTTAGVAAAVPDHA